MKKQMTQQDKKLETIKTILDAAATIFSQTGYGGARMDEIAKLAGVNKATIYYHVGGKDEVYAEVLHQVFSHAYDYLFSRIKDITSPEKKLETYIQGIGELMEKNPLLPSIMMQEVATGGHHFPEKVALDIAQILTLPYDIYMEGVKQGVFIETFPLMVHMMIVGTMAFYRTSEPIRERYLSLADAFPHIKLGTLADMPDEVSRLIVNALKK